MSEQELKAFIDVVVRYFQEVAGEQAKMGIPTVKTGSAILLGHTGIIGISGAKRGAIYVTADRAMLAELASIILGTTDVHDDDVLDMVGELSNTIAGNVRNVFGNTFMISVPIIVKGTPEDILMKLKPPIFTIPIRWRSHTCYLTVGLE
ncbi:MAG: chemotaxis protein CheX [Spirochaetaceae bacterium]|nr:MAG: chemotaxis protein CheX [Spirochaetaceae bacterium]